jgi:iron(III) transport system permease protein
MYTFVRNVKSHFNGWLILSLLGAAVILLPSFFIITSLFSTPNENWQQIKDYLLKDYILESFILVLFTGLFTVIIGVLLAWIISAYDFPGKRFFRWAMILPLGIPPYIGAYTYSNMLSYTGIVQTNLRKLGMEIDPRFFDIMSVPGAIFIFTLFLYPYVYLITRTFLEGQSGSYMENALLLGRTPGAIFFKVVLPLSRPAIIGGVMLVIFEVLSDYGVTSYFGIQTITTAIFHTWFGMYDVDSALRLAAWLMIAVIGLFILERRIRHNRKFHATTSKSRPLVPRKLKGTGAILAIFVCMIVFALAFLIPLAQLMIWAFWTYQEIFTSSFWEWTFNSLKVAAIATLLIMVLSLIVANVTRLQSNWFTTLLSKIITSGYSLPGAVIAIGVLAIFISFINRLGSSLLLSMSFIMLIFGNVVRFMATGYNPVEAGFQKIGKRYLEVSRLLGHSITRTLFKVDIPLMKGVILGGALLTFVEIIKELPMALLLRPFNFETLATKTYQYASNEQIAEAAIPSLFIIGVCLLSIYIFHQLGRRLDT